MEKVLSVKGVDKLSQGVMSGKCWFGAALQLGL